MSHSYRSHRRHVDSPLSAHIERAQHRIEWAERRGERQALPERLREESDVASPTAQQRPSLREQLMAKGWLKPADPEDGT